MRIRMLVDRTGTDDGRQWPPAGGEVDVPDELGAAVCEMRWAVPVAVPEPVEVRAAVTAPEPPQTLPEPDEPDAPEVVAGAGAA